ncbi:uncharacterized protein [Pocillopora verrucosa]|uniref:uncharacterized protein n=1 Tax=Pocillopora verrucosa TaxID=203993 RepID=UPI00333FE566
MWIRKLQSKEHQRCQNQRKWMKFPPHWKRKKSGYHSFMARDGPRTHGSKEILQLVRTKPGNETSYEPPSVDKKTKKKEKTEPVESLSQRKDQFEGDLSQLRERSALSPTTHPRKELSFSTKIKMGRR